MAKIDYKKELKEFYKPSAGKVVEVDVPVMNFLVVDGMGAPDPDANEVFRHAIEALFSVSYTLRFQVRDNDRVDYGVMPLEGLWWADDMSDFITGNKDNWKWTLMIMQPKPVTADKVAQAMDTVKGKKDLAAIDRLQYESFTEGRAAQVLHVGPFTEEGPTVERVHAFIRDSGRDLAGKHHEIYLSDFRRTAPQNLKTVIRQPMA